MARISLDFLLTMAAAALSVGYYVVIKGNN